MAGTRDSSADDSPDKENMCANSQTCSANENLCSSTTWKFASDISKLAEQMATHAADREGRLLGEIATLRQKLCVYTGAVYELEQKLYQSEARAAKLEKQVRQEQQMNWCRYEPDRDFLGDTALLLYPILEEDFLEEEEERPLPQPTASPPIAHFQVGASVEVLRTDGAWSFGRVSEIQGQILVVALGAGRLMKSIDLGSVPSHLVGSIIRLLGTP